MRGRAGTSRRWNDPTPSYLLLVALTLTGCIAVTQAAGATARGKSRLPLTAAATAAPIAEAAAALAAQRNQSAQARSDVIEEIVLVDEESATVVPENATVNSNLTGNPQNDYKYDPNLPRELNGLNLSDYPFYSTVPDEIDFKCDGLHDGFYASVQHKCQVYHHCLYGTRYDFLCANYTAFDQRTFICHFVSEVDCVNSPKFFKRNEALYKQDTTTTSSTTTTTTTTTPAPHRERDGGGRNGGGGRRRRPGRPRRPSYDEYEYDDEYDYYEDEPPSRRPSSKRNRRPQHRHRDMDGDDYQSPPPREKPAPVADDAPLPSKPNKAVFEKPRVIPRIRPPVPLSERDKYARPGDDATTEKPKKSNKRPSEEYYDEEEEEAPAPPPRKNKKQQHESFSDDDDFRRMPTLGSGGRPARRNRGPGGRRRPSRPYYEDEEDDYREESRPMRKRPNRRPYADEYEDEPPRSRKPARQRQREYDDDYEEEERERRPAKKSSTTTTSTTTTTTTTPKPTTTTKRPKPSSTTPAYDDEEYYDDEIYEDELPVVKKPQKAPEEPSTSSSTTTTTTTTTTAVPTPSTRRPFAPKPKASTPAPDISQKFKLSTAEKEESFEFSIDDYVKPSTRAPFIPRGPKATTSTTSTTSTEAPKTREPVRQPIKSRVPVDEEDYDYNIKPVRVQQQQQQPQFTSRTPAKTAPTGFSSSAEAPPSRGPPQSRNPPKQQADFSSEEQEPKQARFPPRGKPAAAAPDFTSPADEEYRTIVARKPEVKQQPTEYKTPSPPPRSRLPTSFLPRGLSPVGGARVKSTTPPPVLYDDEEDEAFNDALHPTGADSSSTLRYSTLTQPQNRLPPIRGSQQRASADQPEVTAPSQSGFSRLPLYDDEPVASAPSAPAAGRTTGQFQARQQLQYQQNSQVQPTAYDAYQRQASSSASSSSYRPQSRQQPQAPQQRGTRPLAAAASNTQYQGWGRDYYFPTY